MLWFILGLLLGCVGAYLLITNEVRVFTRQVSLSRHYKSLTPIQIRSSDPNLMHLVYEINHFLADYSELLKQNQEMIKQHKQLTTSIAHDFRTPLTSILGYVQLLQDTETNVTNQQRLHLIEKRIKVLNNLIEDFYTISQLSSNEYPLQIRAENPIRLLDEQLALYYDSLTQAFDTVNIDIEASQVHIPLDDHAFDRIIGNLIKNALIHGVDTLSIEAKLVNDLRITFTNNIKNPIDIQHIFKRNYKQNTNSIHGSSGLGLSIAYELAEAMKMTLEAHCTEDAISFVLLIPIKR